MKSNTVDVDDARNRFDELLAAAESGDVVLITREGRPIARLTACDAPRNDERIADAISGLLSLRSSFLHGGQGLTLDEIQDARDEGRR